MKRAACLGTNNFLLDRSEHAHTRYHRLFFLPPVFSPYMGREEFFFFQAEDGIRDPLVTGVQTRALPIFVSVHADERDGHMYEWESLATCPLGLQIGRASCRERVSIYVVAVSLKKKT